MLHMKIVQLHVENYRGLRDVLIPMSRFGCVIGENNAGKSSVLQALALFESGGEIRESDFFDPKQPVRIKVTFEDITAEDLGRLEAEHRTKISSELKHGRLVLVRRYEKPGKGQLRLASLAPNDERFLDANVDELVKGKKDSELREIVTERYPEVAPTLPEGARLTQATVRERIAAYIATMPDSVKSPADVPIPTGFDKSIVALLPECIYIPAVKDLGDEVKTSQSSSFGKLIKILLDEISSKLNDVEAMFAKLNRIFNIEYADDGTPRDNRLKEVQKIEQTIGRFLQEGFPEVSIRLEIPPPELSSVLTSARIIADDGVEGSFDSKGDGLRRSLTFAILRAYVELKKDGAFSGEVIARHARPYMLLFEEPELYLYPKAQQQLFEALVLFSQSNFVLVSTHSPTFFGPRATQTFVKLVKKRDPLLSSKPFTHAYHVDVSSMSARDQFQIICHENNNAAFFSDRVLLVEGDSDFLVVRELSAALKADWSFAKHPIAIAKINGKGSIARYREFFQKFGVGVAVLADLDVVVTGFEKLGADEQTVELRGKLLKRIDEVISSDVEPGSLNAKELADLKKSGDARALWRSAQETNAALANGAATFEELDKAVSEFFALQQKGARLDALRAADDSEISGLKAALLDTLREQYIFVLSEGEIEDYYPLCVSRDDKPSMALAFCDWLLANRDGIRKLDALSRSLKDGKCEFDRIFEQLFSFPSAAVASEISFEPH
jgi:predicted ATP-dependent endonuclease of OLD family